MFNKRKRDEAAILAQNLLNSQEGSIFIGEQATCTILLANEAAKNTFDIRTGERTSCESGLQFRFPNICDFCPRTTTKNTTYPLNADIVDAGGKTYCLRVNTLDWPGGKKAFSMNLRDVDEERKLDKKLYSLAYHDQLTGVPNRTRLREDFDAIAPKIKDNDICGVIALFDLDNFKTINDNYGHNTGDVMLRRLTEHLEMNPLFAGRLYRLGGDEFILFYHEPGSSYSSSEQLKEHFRNLLSGVLLSYTLPTIETSCTVSMGVSFFPEHGSNYSELLRKADIALYQAKGQGRGCCVFFEDRFDSAKKFKDLYINIQPILSAGGSTFGYELIDRGSKNEGDKGSASLNDFDRTMDAIDLSGLESNAKYFIHYSKHLLNKAVHKNLPKNKFVVQICLPEEVGPEELAEYRQLRMAGYTLAFADINSANLSADLFKYGSFLKLNPAVLGHSAVRQILQSSKDKHFIAEGVNTAADWEEARQLGFTLFQGYYFSQEDTVTKTKDIDPLKANYYRLMKLSSADGYVNFPEISEVISSDLALSYKLLRLLNSAAVGLRGRVTSISMAVAYLGEEGLKQWISMLALRGLADDKPLELVRLSLVRARFGELLAHLCTPKRDARHVFLVGMFSLLHIALEKSREELFEEIPVAADIRQSLLTGNGPYSDFVAFFNNYEYSNWDEVNKFAEDNGLNGQRVSDAYVEAVKWYSMLTEDMQAKE